MNAQEIYEEDLVYEEAGDYVNAASKFIAAFTFNRTLPIAYKLGKILFNYHKYAEALHCFMTINDLSEIKKCFEKLDEIYPNDPYINDIKGDCYSSSGLMLEAQKYYYKTLKLSKYNSEFKYDVYYKIISLSQQDYDEFYYEFDIGYISATVNSLGNNNCYSYNYETGYSG